MSIKTDTITLTASDGHKLSAYRADPTGTAKGGIVVLQEIFGVNHHIRAVCDSLAEQGYTAVAPALFDRKSPGFESGYTDEDIAEARKYLENLDVDAMLLDTKAALDEASKGGLKAAVMGYCLGGSIAFLAATRLDGVAAAICYYGGLIAKFVDEKPKCPTLMHYGEADHSIPMTDVAITQNKRTDCDVYVYPAGHGFSCDERGSYNEASAKLAWERSKAVLDKQFA